MCGCWSIGCRRSTGQPTSPPAAAHFLVFFHSSSSAQDLSGVALRRHFGEDVQRGLVGADHGSTADAATFNNSFAITANPDALQQALTNMQSTGILGLEQQTNSNIMAPASTLSSMASGKQPLKLAAYRNGSAGPSPESVEGRLRL